MATIRVSSLPEIKVDRITDDDYYIVNDGDITTSKLSFKQMVLGIAQKDIEFSGVIKFSGDVEFDGSATGPFPNTGDVYTKAEIDITISELEQYDQTQDDKLNPLILLSGELEGTTFYRDFPKGIISSGSTCRGALTDLESYAFDNRDLIQDLTDIQNDKDAEISDIVSDVIALEATVGGLSTDVSGLLVDVAQINVTLPNHESRISVLETDTTELKKRSVMFQSLGYTKTYVSATAAKLDGLQIGDTFIKSSTNLENGLISVIIS